MATIIRTLRPIDAQGCTFPTPGTVATVSDTAAAALIASGDAYALDGPPAGWDDLRVSLTKAGSGANAPTFDVFRSAVQAWSFSKTLANELFFDVQLPHNWVAGTDILPHIHWSPGNSTNTGKVRWQLEYTWANVSDAFPAPTVMTAVDVAASGVAYSHQLTKLGTCTGTDKRLSSVLMCRIARVGNATEDTFDAVAWGLSLDFHIQVRGFGGSTETAGA